MKCSATIKVKLKLILSTTTYLPIIPIIFFLQSCATAPAPTDPYCYADESTLKPDWVKDQSSNSQFYVGVGSSEYAKGDKDKQRMTAYNIALRMLSSQLVSNVDSTYEEVTTNKSDYAKLSVNVQTNLTMKYAKIDKQWIDSSNCMMWVKIKINNRQAAKIITDNALSKKRIKELNELHKKDILKWGTIENSTSPDVFLQYIQNNPQGLFLATAQLKLDDLNDKELNPNILEDDLYIQQLLQNAFDGDDQAQNLLADRYRKGWTFQQDFSSAKKWYKKSAQQNNHLAEYNLANLYITGDGGEKNIPLGLSLYTKSALGGYETAQLSLAKYHLNKIKRITIMNTSQESITKDCGYPNELEISDSYGYEWSPHVSFERDSLDSLFHACSQKSARNEIPFDISVTNLTLSQELKTQIEDASKIAFLWLQKASEQQNVEAQFLLGEMYLEGKYIKKNAALGFQEIFKSANQGSSVAQNKLGTLYQTGVGTNISLKKAINSYELSVAQQNANAMANLGYLYKFGLGVEKDKQKAYFLFENASDLGDSWGKYNLANMYFSGDVVKTNKQRALDLYKESADKKSGIAAMRLGDLYLESNENEKAGNMYAKAEALGIRRASYSLALLANEGTALQLFYMKKAAKNNVKDAQNWLAWFYIGEYEKICLGSGHTCTASFNPDHKKAYRLFTSTKNDYGLATMYYKGLFVMKNVDEALVLAEKALGECIKEGAECSDIKVLIGYIYLSQENGSKAIKYWTNLPGDKGELAASAYIYYYGIGVPIDKNIAYKYLIKLNDSTLPDYHLDSTWSEFRNVDYFFTENKNKFSRFSCRIKCWEINSIRDYWVVMQLAIILKEGKKAEVDLDRAIQLFKSIETREAKYQLIEIYNKKGQFEKTIEILRTLPYDDSKFELATAYLKNNQKQKAKKTFQPLAKKGNVEAKYQLALIFADENKPRPAIAILKSLESDKAQLKLSEIYFKRKEYDKARITLKRLVRKGNKIARNRLKYLNKIDKWYLF